MPQGDYRDGHYSEETREILGKLPSWIVRWGIMLLFIILAGVVTGCYFIKYPETVEASISITTENPPSDLMARSEGLLQKVLVESGGTVEAGGIIAVIENPADFGSVLVIRDSLKSSLGKPYEEFVAEEWLDKEYVLGDLQSTYAEFRRQCMEYRTYMDISLVAQKKRLLGEQIAKQKEYFGQLGRQERLMLEDMELERKNYERDSALYSQNVLSTYEMDAAASSYISKKSSMESFKASMISTELSIIQLEQQLVELSIQLQDETSAYERNLSQSRQSLLSQIEQWKKQYVIESPIDGIVTFTSYWSENQRVNAGDRIASVIPSRGLHIIGRMNIPMSGLGKVRAGQGVNVKLNVYPYMEFGMLKGKITKISAVPETVIDYTTQSSVTAYIAEVAFPGGLTTTYGKELTLIQQMDGSAEIITEPRRLIQRFLDPIKALFDDK